MHFLSLCIKTTYDKVGSSEDAFYPPLFVHVVNHVYFVWTTYTFRSHMRPDLRKATFHANNSKTHFSPSKFNDSCTHALTNNSGRY